MNPLPSALAVRSASLTLRLNEAALAKAVSDGASPACLAELGGVVLDCQGAYRQQLLELAADIADELTLLPDQPARVAGEHNEGKGW